jgi:hypothetical protein
MSTMVMYYRQNSTYCKCSPKINSFVGQQNVNQALARPVDNATTHLTCLAFQILDVLLILSEFCIWVFFR